MKKIFYLLLLFALSLEACYEDKGNYNYNPIPPVEMSGIDAEYTVYSMRDTLHICPKFPGKENYNFVWTLFSNTIVKAPVDTISYDADLHYKVVERSDNYTLSLTVENKGSGDRQFFTTKVTINTQFSAGCYILKEMEGETDVDLFTLEKTLTENILKNTSSRISGMPMTFIICPDINYIDEEGKAQSSVKTVWICSDHDARMLTLEHMAPVYDIHTMFYEEQPNEQPQSIAKNVTSLVYLSNNGFYNLALNALTAAHKFGLPLRVSNASAEESENCSCSKQVICGLGYFMFYDESNNRFLVVINGQMKKFSNTDKKGDPTSSILTPNNMDCELIYMGNTATNGYALMYDRKNQRKIMYKMEMTEYDKYDGQLFSPLLDVNILPPSLKIHHGETFGHNTTYPYTYFSIDNKLNLYDFNTNQEMEDILPGLEGKITLIKHIKGQFSFGKASEYLVVATEQGGRYKLYFCEMLAGKPDLSKTPMVIEGEGRAVQINIV